MSDQTHLKSQNIEEFVISLSRHKTTCSDRIIESYTISVAAMDVSLDEEYALASALRPDNFEDETALISNMQSQDFGLGPALVQNGNGQHKVTVTGI